ncbi:MAG TPA: hypothetical protein PLA87_23765 [Pseudomonadota bacterium]|mgnify:CR=1 FL=1|jgi:hypothetical protein|nr:hypothetical protein [Pseudomonadota bacterium]
MQRVNLFEFEDFDWLPAPIRDGGTDLLDLGFRRIGFFDGVAHKLIETLQVTGATRVLDMCSGGGGGTLQLLDHVRATGLHTEFVFSDRHPNAAGITRVAQRMDPSAHYERQPLDAMTAFGSHAGLRTMSGALHHFTPDAVQAILAAVIERRAPLAFFDIAASPVLRQLPIGLAPLAMIPNMLMLFVASLLAVPFLRPFRLSRLLFTYVLPLIPALVAWDGTASALRAYSPDELLSLAQAVPGAAGYRWESRVIGSALYLTGVPL